MNKTVTTTDRIKAKCAELADFLCKKNESYGDSALHPISIFAGGRATDSLNARIDDKLARIRNIRRGWSSLGEDAVLDLTGYLILLMLAREDKLNEVVGASKAVAETAIAEKFSQDDASKVID